MSTSTRVSPENPSPRTNESYSLCCFKISAPLVDGVAHVTKGLELLAGFWICLTLLFLTVVSVSVGLSILGSILIKRFLDYSLPNEYQAIMALMILTTLSDRVYRGDSYVMSCATKFANYAENWETILAVGFGILGLGHLFLAFPFLYFGYQYAHPSIYFGDKDVKEIDPKGMNLLNGSCTILAPFGLGMFAHIVPPIMKRAIRDYEFSWKCCLAFTPLFIGQILLLGIYTVPLVVLIHPCNFFNLPPGVTFFVSLIFGGICAFYATKFDNFLLKRIDDGEPYYFYENFCFAGVFLFQYVMIPVVVLLFNGNFGMSNLSPAIQFHIYTIWITLAVIQALKSIFHQDDDD